jgi:hypothetical protein
MLLGNDVRPRLQGNPYFSVQLISKPNLALYSDLHGISVQAIYLQFIAYADDRRCFKILQVFHLQTVIFYEVNVFISKYLATTDVLLFWDILELETLLYRAEL